MIGPTPPPSFPARGRLVGRDDELAALLAAVQDCCRGQPMVILITGEPGVGKTRLMTEVSARAAAELGARVLTGSAIESGGMPAYYPIGRAIRGAVDQLVRSAPAIGQSASILAKAGLVTSEHAEGSSSEQAGSA